RLLMLQYAYTKDQLDRLYLRASCPGSERFSTNRKVDDLCRQFEGFLSQYPTHGEAMNVYGTLLDDIGKGDEAMEVWERAMRLSQTNPELLNNLANYYGHNGRAEQAIRMYEQAIQINPQQAVYHFNLANMYYLFRKETMTIHPQWDLKKTFEMSLFHFRMASQIAPDNVEYATSYAETFYGVNFLTRAFDWRDAETAWKKCLPLRSDRAFQDSIHLHLLRVSAYQNKPAEALEYYNTLQGGDSRRMGWQLMRRFFPEDSGVDA
ncbi:MAG: tetratricopeptide repeat protein, partial [Verrucomicrobiae bacterium]|nr:tetratricopeptide repeat protein [Verrucomicrobiae bacterium]